MDTTKRLKTDERTIRTGCIMRRGYDPGYGSREQLKACHEQGMKVARERDALKIENAELNEQIIGLIAYIAEFES